MTVPSGQVYQVLSVTLNLSSAPTTSENFTLTLDAVDGNNYDTVLYSLDLSAASTTDLLWQPDEPPVLVGGDGLDAVWANTDNRTWGLMMTMQRV